MLEQGESILNEFNSTVL